MERGEFEGREGVLALNVQTGRVDSIRPIMLNGFHGLYRVTCEIVVSGVLTY
jgi:hypothetical protein